MTKARCPETRDGRPVGVPCDRSEGHPGVHVTRDGHEWLTPTPIVQCADCRKDMSAPVQWRYLERVSAPNPPEYRCLPCLLIKLKGGSR